MKKLLFLLAIIIEFLLLFFILMIFILGILGIFLPILPGLLLVAFAAAIYSLMLKNYNGKITPIVNIYLLKFRDKINKLPITQKFMGIINKIKQLRLNQGKENILKYGLILFVFNLGLVFAFIFAFSSLSNLASLLGLTGLWLAFVPLIVIFTFAGVSAVVWYRFGQVLGRVFKKKKITSTALVVLISLLPLLAIFFLLSAIVSVVGGFSNEFLAITFLAIILMSILSAVFEMLIVSIGAVVKVLQ